MQLRIGVASGTDVATQEAQLAAVKAALVPLKLQLAQAFDQIASLVGKAPAALSYGAIDLDRLVLPPTLPQSLPAELLKQRPDQRYFRLAPEQILTYPIAYLNGQSVPLSAVTTISSSVVPESISHFQQLTSTTISATLAPNVTQSQAYAYLKDTARKMLPAGYSTDTVGSLRQFVRLPILSVEVNDFDQSINRSAIGCSG
jgi:hypothetical protein